MTAKDSTRGVWWWVATYSNGEHTDPYQARSHPAARNKATVQARRDHGANVTVVDIKRYKSLDDVTRGRTS